MAQQFQSANKLPHLTWIFPNAPHNHDAMTTAWYPIESFSPIPVGRRIAANAAEEEDEVENEAESAILESVEYLCALVDEEVKNGVPPDRIVIGGFSQGCAVSLVAALSSRYAGKLAGVVGLSGYLPQGETIQARRREFSKVPNENGLKRVFLGHGTRDMLLPLRIFRSSKDKVERAVGSDMVEAHEYEGMGHTVTGEVLGDMCSFLEAVVPLHSGD